MNKKYEAIINLPHHTSPDRARMSGPQRAAQFAPFAALTGFDEVLAETARQTEQEIFLDEGEKAEIDGRLRWLKEHLSECPAVRIKIFCPDRRKEGGSYRIIEGRVMKIDEYCQKLWLDTGETVQFDRIIQLFT